MVKDTVRSKRGSGVTPTHVPAVPRPNIGHNDAVPSRRRKAREVAASIRRKFVPTRTNRGKPCAFLEPMQMLLGQPQHDINVQAWYPAEEMLYQWFVDLHTR